MLGAGSIGKALNIASCENAHGSFDVWSLIKKAGKRLAAQPVQGGFVAAIDTEPVVADGRTCL